MRVVSNSTPLIFLAKLGKLNLVMKLFEAVMIPEEVYNEVVTQGKEKRYNDAFLVEEIIKGGTISKEKVVIDKLLGIPLGRGELEAIELAIKLDIKDLLIDEAKGRRIARIYNLSPKGTIWVLTKANESDLLSKSELKSSIIELIKLGYRLREDILVELLNELG